MYFAKYDSPVGKLLLQSDGAALTGAWIGRAGPENTEGCMVLQKAALWLDDYFAGNSRPVDVALHPEGTDFQKQVWQLLLTIPFGKTQTYGDLAWEMARLRGKENMSAQAIGQAVGKNPISIFIPCHRVVGVGGKLTGYAWGVEKKQWLLRHEARNQ